MTAVTRNCIVGRVIVGLFTLGWWAMMIPVAGFARVRGAATLPPLAAGLACIPLCHAGSVVLDIADRSHSNDT
ncbi:hypothetical protein OS187_11870 [Xanthomonadaceae bacterium JHOS43]|nr:hypothetical protein [Xanthomonadaceae bacterium JHOS43]MCX7561979.1 hypothetical protein [Xanthomonadaceae bacterium XH05]